MLWKCKCWTEILAWNMLRISPDDCSSNILNSYSRCFSSCSEKNVGCAFHFAGYDIIQHTTKYEDLRECWKHVWMPPCIENERRLNVCFKFRERLHIVYRQLYSRLRNSAKKRKVFNKCLPVFQVEKNEGSQ